MTLGEFITKYREEHGNMSIRAFASMVGMSTQQISNIEKGIGNDKKPMTSTMKTYQKIAQGIGMEERAFLKLLNDEVIVNPSDEKIPVSETDEELSENILIAEKLQKLTPNLFIKFTQFLELAAEDPDKAEQSLSRLVQDLESSKQSH